MVLIRSLVSLPKSLRSFIRIGPSKQSKEGRKGKEKTFHKKKKKKESLQNFCPKIVVSSFHLLEVERSQPASFAVIMCVLKSPGKISLKSARSDVIIFLWKENGFINVHSQQALYRTACLGTDEGWRRGEPLYIAGSSRGRLVGRAGGCKKEMEIG